MTTLQTSQKTCKTVMRKASTRTFTINRRETPETAGLLTITIDGVSESYLFRQHVDGDGCGYTLCHAEDSERCYSVVVSPRRLSCSCKGFSRWSHCKHASLCSVMVARDAASAVPVCQPKAKSLMCYRCRDTKVVRGNGVVSRCTLCAGV